MATFAPASASLYAIPYPIPTAPVTIAVLPARSRSLSIGINCINANHHLGIKDFEVR
jgi:hypothetical protein